MKQVNRKFLEEQVKLSLKEIGIQDVGAGSAVSKEDKPGIEKAHESVGKFLKYFFLGADESYEAVGTWLKDLGLYGVGDTKYITKVLDTLPKLSSGPNAGINQTALRFMNVDPFTGDYESKLTFKPEIVKYLTNLRDKWTPIIEKAKKSGNKQSIKSAVEGMLKGQGGLKDAAEKYDFGQSSSLVKIFQSEESPTVPMDKVIWNEVSDENLERYVDYLLNSKDTSRAVEILIMSQFPYLRNLTFKEAYTKLASETDIKTLLTGIISFNHFKNNAARALYGASDIILSLGTTLAFVAKPLLAAKSVTPLVNKALSNQVANASMNLIKTMGSGKSQFVATVPMLYGFVNEMLSGIDDQMQDLQEVLVKYFNTYENKSKQDREEFYNKEVLPLVQDINKLHATGMYEFFKNVKGQVDTADFENVIKLISSDKTFESKIRNHVLDFDAKSALGLVSSLQKNIKDRIKTPGIKKFINILAKSREEASKAKEEISNIEKVNIPLVIPNFEKEEAAIPSKDVESPAKQETEILVFGDSIGHGIRSELGVKGSAAENLRTDQILKNMEDFFSSQEVNESKENEKNKKTIIISAGINDLASGISPEKIIGNLNKMINLAKSKGYNVRVVPLLGWKGKKQDQIDQINTALSNNPNITLIDKSGIELSDGIHPKGYKDLASRATSGVQYKKPKKQDKAPLQKKRLAPAVKPNNKAEKYFPIVNTVASSEGLNPYLMMGIIFAESGFNPNAVSNKGAQGLMQLMPRTASEFDVSDPFNPEQNIKGGAKAFRTIRDVYVPRVMEKTGTKIKWNSLTEEEKDRLGLYAYNFGPNGLLVNNFKIEKSDTIEDYFARVNAWYLKKFGYDYADKIFRYANAYGGDYKKLGTSQAGIKKPLKTEPAGEPITTSTTTDTKAIQEQISAIDKASNFNELMSAYDNLFGKTLGSVARSTSDIILAHNQLDKEDLSSFLKDRVEYLKAIHSANRSDWKKEYENDLKDPKKKDDADKKMAFYHRPILYTTLRPSGAQKFFSDAINMSFGFEPNTNAVSVNYSGGAQWGVPDTFYKEHRQGNKNYSRFLSELQLLDSATKSVQDKVKDLSSSDSENRDALNELSEYTSRLADIVNVTNRALRDPSTSVSRKAYLLSVLDLALRTI